MWRAPLGKRRELMITMGAILVSSLLLLTPQPTVAFHSPMGEPPQFTTEPPKEKVVFLDNFEEVNGVMVNLVLPCATSGTPDPTIAWFREGEELGSGVVMSDGRLAINVTMAQATRAGTIYYCTATNMIGPDSSILASVRSRDVNVTHAYFDGFEEMTSSGVTIETLQRGSVALRCDFRASNPPATVQWFRGPAGSINTPINQDIANNNAVLYLEEGRYLYIRQLSSEDRNMRYQCVVTVFNGVMRAPTTYRIDEDIATEGLTLYRPLGTVVGRLNQPLRFVYAAANRDSVGDFLAFSVDCPSEQGLALNHASTYVVTATLTTPPPNGRSRVFGCELIGTGVQGMVINGTIVLSGAPTFNDSNVPAETDRERVVGGGAVVYSCAATGIPDPMVRWYYNGQSLDSGVDANGVLTIEEPQIEDSGVYQCMVSNPFDVISRRWTLEVREPVFPVISSVVETSGADVDRQEGTLIVEPLGTLNRVINVVVEADPCPAVLWSFTGSTSTMDITANGSDFKLNQPCSDETESSPYNFTLTITNLTEATSGAYGAAFTVLDTVVPLDRLFVTVPVPIEVESLDIMVEVSPPRPQPPMCLLEGSNVIFTCEIAGFPRPEIVFRKGPTIIMPGEAGFTRVERINPDQIRFTNINSTDEGEFTCEAVIPGADPISLSPREQIFCTDPVITEYTATQDPREGNELIIVCMVTGTPDPEVLWTKDNVTLDSSQENIFISVDPHDQVRIDPATPEDSGVYRCRARNQAGSTEQEMRIDVEPSSLSDFFTTTVIIAIVLLVLLLICVYYCARKRSSGSADFQGYSYPAMSGDGRGNVDADSYDGGQPEEAFEPDYDSVPTRRPNEPPPYKDTPGYQHGAPLAGDELEMIKYPPQDSESFVTGVPPYQRPSQDNGYRPTPNAEDFLSEDAQFV